MCRGAEVLTVLKDEPVHVKMVYVVCQMLANTRPTIWKGNAIEKGEFITSRASMAKACSISEKLVRAAWLKLEALGLISVRADQYRFSRVKLAEGLQTGQQNEPINQHKTEHTGQRTGHSIYKDYHAVLRSSGVDVDLALFQNVVSADAASPPTTHEPIKTNLEKFIAVYNDSCPRLKKAIAPNYDRERLFKRAWKESGGDEAYWQRVFQRAEESFWMTARKPGFTGCYKRADIGFVLQHHVEILEGKYDEEKPALDPRVTIGAAKPWKEPPVYDMTYDELVQIRERNMGKSLQPT